MAGSYKHATTDSGKLRKPESFTGMVENLGDAYETVEEMYGMIWRLANQLARIEADQAVAGYTDMDLQESAAKFVEQAREEWKPGLENDSPGVETELERLKDLADMATEEITEMMKNPAEHNGWEFAQMRTYILAYEAALMDAAE